nr:hypothetical protein [Chryseobacterium sp. 52]
MKKKDEKNRIPTVHIAIARFLLIETLFNTIANNIPATKYKFNGLETIFR